MRTTTKAKAPKMLSEQRGTQRRALEERYKQREEDAAKQKAQEEQEREVGVMGGTYEPVLQGCRSAGSAFDVF